MQLSFAFEPVVANRLTFTLSLSFLDNILPPEEDVTKTCNDVKIELQVTDMAMIPPPATVSQDTLVIEVGTSYRLFQLQPESNNQNEKTSDFTTCGSHGNDKVSGSHGNGDVTKSQSDDVTGRESFLKPV